MKPYVIIDGAPVSTYFLMALAAIVFTVIITLVKRKAFGLRVRDVLRLTAFAIIGGLIGARLFSSIGQIVLHGREPGFWTADNWRYILSGVGVFYGGLLGSIGMVALWAKIGRLDMKSVFNVVTYAALAFQSVARIGCWCAGCCYGIELASGERFPVQLVEAGFCAIALLAFLIVRPERRWPGMPLLPVYLITYSAGRFVLEFLRGDANRGVFILSTSQWIALVLITLALVWLRKSKFTRPKKGADKGVL